MLRMNEFSFHPAADYAEALRMWTPEAMYVAGGTDLLPNLKHRLFAPKTVIGLGGIRGGVRQEGEVVVIDAGTTLHALASDPLVRERLAPLAHAASVVASPQIRRMGTLGGNILLDTRCLFYNQTEFWRKSLGYCLKAEGSWCHVVGGPKTCVATQSSDTVPVLLALDARLGLLGPQGFRTLALRDLYQFNGMDHLRITPGELLTRVEVPLPAPGFAGTYDKLRIRDAIDFPLLGVAIALWRDGETVRRLELVVGAVNPQPKLLRGVEEFAGRKLDKDMAQAVADLVYKQTRPQASAHGDVAWRRQMAAVFARRALERITDSGAVK